MCLPLQEKKSLVILEQLEGKWWVNARSHYLNSSSILSAFQNLLEILSTETCHYVKHESKGTDDDKIKIAIVCPKNRYIKGAAVSCCSFAMCLKCNAPFIFPFQVHKAAGISDVASQCFKPALAYLLPNHLQGHLFVSPMVPFIMLYLKPTHLWWAAVLGVGKWAPLPI